MSTIDEKNIDPIKEIERIAQGHLGLTNWGFKESYRSKEPCKLILNSQWCRLSIIWDGWDYMGGNTISIRYGRLHAPSEKAVMTWNNEDCRCWHDIDQALHFLDGRSPVDAVRLIYSHPLTNPFYEERSREEFQGRQPEWLAKMHETVWQHYGKRFFELFDLRHTNTWEQYRQFLTEFYDIKGRSSAIKPSLDKVC